MTNSSDNIGILWVCCVVSANFRVNSTRCSSEFHVAFEHFEDFRDLILKILKDKMTISYVVGSCYLLSTYSFYNNTKQKV